MHGPHLGSSTGNSNIPGYVAAANTANAANTASPATHSAEQQTMPIDTGSAQNHHTLEDVQNGSSSTTSDAMRTDISEQTTLLQTSTFETTNRELNRTRVLSRALMSPGDLNYQEGERCLKEQQYDKAIQFFEAGVKLSHDLCMQGLVKSFQEAYTWCATISLEENNFKKNLPTLLYELAKVYELGGMYDEIPINGDDAPDMARILCKTAAHLGEARAWFQYGQWHEYGTYGKSDLATAIINYTHAMDLGYAEATQKLKSLLNQYKTAVIRDPRDADANFFYGSLILRFAKNIAGQKKGVEYVLNAAALGNPLAMLTMGDFYKTEGSWLKADFLEAAASFSAAAEKLPDRAKSKLKALFEVMKQSAQQANDGTSYFQLGEACLRYGSIVGFDSQHAVEWYKKAAELNHVPALKKLIAPYGPNGPNQAMEKDARQVFEYHWQLAQLGQPHSHNGVSSASDQSLDSTTATQLPSLRDRYFNSWETVTDQDRQIALLKWREGEKLLSQKKFGEAIFLFEEGVIKGYIPSMHSLIHSVQLAHQWRTGGHEFGNAQIEPKKFCELMYDLASIYETGKSANPAEPLPDGLAKLKDAKDGDIIRFHLFKTSAQLGQAQALWKMGQYYEKGVVVEAPLSPGQTHPNAIPGTGKYILTQVEINLITAMEYYFVAIKKGNEAAKNNVLAIWKQIAIDIEANPDHAETLYIAASVYSLGLLLHVGGVLEQALLHGVVLENIETWMAKAVQLGNVPAMRKLGNWYETGMLTGQPDLYKALLCYIGLLETAPEEVKEHCNRIFNLIKQDLAETKDANDYFLFAKAYYFYASNVGIHPGEALTWYIKAAEKNHLEALAQLARWYDPDTGLEKNAEQAFKYNLKLAHLGNVEAMRWVSKAYESGVGVEPNPQQAIFWATQVNSACTQ